MNEYNKWDRTIWDPINPEQAIEDTMHGPSAVYDMLQKPAMPFGDGTYYQPGALYAQGTAYLDSQGRPVYHPSSTAAQRRESLAITEWYDAYQQGEETLVALEAARQQDRLRQHGIAHTFKPSDVCPGGSRLADCETGNTAYQAGQEWAAQQDTEKPQEGSISNVIGWAGSACTRCSVSCQVAVTTDHGIPQETRVSFYRPDPTMQTIRLDISAVEIAPVTDPIALQGIADILGRFSRPEAQE
jgi:hypothetical protein